MSEKSGRIVVRLSDLLTGFWQVFKNALRTDGPTDGRTKPLIEMRGCIF